jgi:hypothetical protein
MRLDDLHPIIEGELRPPKKLRWVGKPHHIWYR